MENRGQGVVARFCIQERSVVLHPHQGYTSGDVNLPEMENSTRKVHEQSWQPEMRAKRVERRGDSSRTANDKRVDPSVSLDKTRS